MGGAKFWEQLFIKLTEYEGQLLKDINRKKFDNETAQKKEEKMQKQRKFIEVFWREASKVRDRRRAKEFSKDM